MKSLRSAGLNFIKIGRIPYSKFDVGRSMFIAFQDGCVFDIELQFIGIAVLLAPFEGASSNHVLWAW